MHRIDSQGATAEGRFTEGNPTIPEPATVVSADWLNAVQDEILNVLAEAGMQPDKAKNAQLKEAILKLGPERFKGFSTNGQHAAFEGDLNTVAHNSLYACDSAKVQNAPELPAGTWAFVHTMVLPADAGRTQLCWPADDPDHPGWNRRRTTTGQWSDWKVVGSGDAGVPVGMLCFSSTASPLPGTVAVNVKQKFALGTFPQLEAWVQSSGGYLATEAEWDAEAAAQEGTCNKYCLTDTHIILPCYKHYFAAAQDGVAGKAVGDWAGDEVKSHFHGLQKTAEFSAPNLYALSNQAGQTGHLATQTEPYGGDETRPKTSYILPCIKAYDVAVNAAQVDMQALTAQVAAINGNKVDRSEWTQNHAESGWQKLPSGLILQWGNVVGADAVPIMFPITFPTVCLLVLPAVQDDNGVSGVAFCPGYHNATAEGFTYSGKVGFNGSWFAIGY